MVRATFTTGLTHTATYAVDRRMTVPELFLDDPHSRAMPEVLATGYLVALMERACVEAIAPHLDDDEGSLGIGMDMTHLAPTLVGMTVRIHATCVEVEGRRSVWRIEAHDDLAKIGEAEHARAIVDLRRFGSRLDDLRTRVTSAGAGGA